MMEEPRKNLTNDLGIITLSIVIAIILAKTGILQNILAASIESRIVGNLVAGAFFASIFTVAPATVVLAEIAQANSIFWTAFL